LISEAAAQTTAYRGVTAGGVGASATQGPQADGAPVPRAAAGQAPPRGGSGGQRGNVSQEPAAALRRGVAMTAISCSVSDLARSVAFYRTAFGLEMLGSATLPPASPNAAMVRLVNASGARYRQATLRVPLTGVVLRLMEFSGVERASQRPGVAEPGQVRPRFLVTDMAVELANLKLAGAEIVSSGGQVDALKTPTHVVARDPDGHVIEIDRVEDPQSSATTDVTPVVALHVALTTADTEKKLAFYKNLLGFDVAPGAWSRMPIGAGELKRSTSGELGGANRLLDIAEYRGLGRAMPAHGRVQDPGTGVVSFIVRDLDGALNAVKQAQLRVVSVGEAPVTLAHSPRIVVQDLDGAYIEMIEE
jgi:catechol 2,3-dioxygenase-like lactoylglutathione lyase family enzyme